MPPPSQPPRSAQCFVQCAVEAQCEAQGQVTPANLNITQDKCSTGVSDRPQPEGATGSRDIAQGQATCSITQGTQSAAARVNISADPSHHEQGQPEADTVDVPKAVDKEIQTEGPLYCAPKESTSSDDPEIAVKDQYRTSAKRAR